MVLTAETNTKIVNILIESCLYIPEHTEAMRIDTFDETECMLYCTGEETGESYAIAFEDIDMDTAMFYRFQLVDTK